MFWYPKPRRHHEHHAFDVFVCECGNDLLPTGFTYLHLGSVLPHGKAIIPDQTAAQVFGVFFSFAASIRDEYARRGAWFQHGLYLLKSFLLHIRKAVQQLLSVANRLLLFLFKAETFYYLLGLFKKLQRVQRHAEKNNTPLRLSASSTVNLFCHDPFIRNKLQSH